MRSAPGAEKRRKGEACNCLRFEGLPIFGSECDWPEVGSRSCKLKRNKKFAIDRFFRPNRTALPCRSGLKILQQELLLSKEFHPQREKSAVSVDHQCNGRLAHNISLVKRHRNHHRDP